MRPILFAAALAIAGVCAYVVLRSDRPAAPAPSAEVETHAKGPSAPPSSGPSLPSGAAEPAKGSPPRAKLDADVADAVAKVMPNLKTRDDLDNYLDSLEAKARAQGKVTALELEPGLKAIEAFGNADPQEIEQRQTGFAARMAVASAQMKGRVSVSDFPRQGLSRALEALEKAGRPPSEPEKHRIEALIKLVEASGAPDAGDVAAAARQRLERAGGHGG